MYYVRVKTGRNSRVSDVQGRRGVRIQNVNAPAMEDVSVLGFSVMAIMTVEICPMNLRLSVVRLSVDC